MQNLIGRKIVHISDPARPRFRAHGLLAALFPRPPLPF